MPFIHPCNNTLLPFIEQLLTVADLLHLDKLASGVEGGAVQVGGVSLFDFQLNVSAREFEFPGSAVAPGIFPLERRLIVFELRLDHVGIVDRRTVDTCPADLETNFSVFDPVNDYAIGRF